MGMTTKEYHEGYQQGYKDAKEDYETRLKADMVAMLTEIQLEIEELDTPNNGSAYMDCADIIQQKIDALKGEQEAADGKD